MSFCGDLFDLIESKLQTPSITHVTSEMVYAYFQDNVQQEFFNQVIEDYGEEQATEMQQNLQKILAEVTPEKIISQETSQVENVDESEIDTQKEFIDTSNTFTSKDEAIRGLFAGKDHLFLRYESFIGKFLVTSLFFNPKLSTWITNDADMKVALAKVVNSFAAIILNKQSTDAPFLNITDGNISYNKNELYSLNYEANKIIKDIELDYLEKITFGKPNSIEQRKLVAAISYSNFNTILKSYLPGVLTINSSMPGFDIDNINNVDLFSINGSTQNGDWMNQDKVTDDNSSLAKLLFDSFEKIHAHQNENGDMIFDLNAPVNFDLAMYYYMGQNLSTHLATDNYQNEFNQLLTAMMQRNIDIEGGNKLQEFESTLEGKKLIGKFNSDYFTDNPSLYNFLEDSTTQSVIATLYYNISLRTDDPIFSMSKFSNAFRTKAQDKFSLSKAHAKYSNQMIQGKSNIHDVIFATFGGQSGRSHHDIAFDFGRGVILSEPLNQRNINAQAFEMQKVYKYLRSFTNATRNIFMPSGPDSRTENSITLLVNGKPLTIKTEGQDKSKKWVTSNLQEFEKQQIYRFFQVLTKYDISEDPLLQTSAQFKIDNMIQVIYAMIGLHDESNLDTKKRLLENEKSLKEQWNVYSVSPHYVISNILLGMGSQFGKMNGVLSRMTILNKEKKALPMYGPVNISTTFKQHVQKMRNKKKTDDKGREIISVFTNNVFYENEQLFKGTSAKNHIFKQGTISVFKDQNRTDQTITNILYEYFQRRNDSVQRKADTDEGINNDGTVHFQPVVYADKTGQNVMKINTTIPAIRYWVGGQAYYVNSNNLNTFAPQALVELKDAQFHTLRTQHKYRHDKILKSFNNILESLGQPIGDSIVTQFNSILQYRMSNNNISLEKLWRDQNPGEVLTNNLFFEKNKGVYSLNNTQLFYFKMFESQSTIPNKTQYENYQNLGIIEFLQNLQNMNIDQSSDELKIFKKQDSRKQELIQDLNILLNDEHKKLLNDLLQDIKVQIQDADQDLVMNETGKYQNLHKRIQAQLLSSSKTYQQYYWENTFFGQNYEMYNNGPIYLHPQKGKSTPSLYSEISLRLGASQKRNVTYSATVTPYTYGINGPSRVRNVCIIQEPKNTVSNPMGEISTVDSHDGGEMILMLHRILENNSMQTFSNDVNHKAINMGRSINANGEFQDSILFKYASYSVGHWKLKQSANYRNMIQYALSRPLQFLDTGLYNFITDYNGKVINYTDFNINIKTNNGFKKLISLDFDGTNYTVVFQNYITTDNVTKMTEELSTKTFAITNLFELYSEVLGGENTVDLNRQNEMIGYNNKSWEALQFLCCRVGFRLDQTHLNATDPNSIQNQYARMSQQGYEELLTGQNNVIDNQQNVVQPLKFSYISQFTPESCIKYGGSPGNDINYFRDDNLTTDFAIHRVQDQTAGVQQASGHEGDEQPESTQMINGTSLDNQSPEFLDLNKHIAKYVIKNIDKTYEGSRDVVLDEELLKDDDQFLIQMRQMAFIYHKLKKQILSSAYDNGQTAQLVLTSALDFAELFIELDGKYSDNVPQEKTQKIQRARELSNAFTISLSHSSVYSMFIATLASANTKMGVRRKTKGAVTVQTPHEGFLSFIEVPTLEEMIHDPKFYEDNPNYLVIEGTNKVFNYTSYTTMTADQYRDFSRTKLDYQYLELNRYKLVWRKVERTMEDGTIKEGSEIDEFNLGMYKHYKVMNADGVEKTRYIKTIAELNTLKEELYTKQLKSIHLDKLSGLGESENEGRHLKHIDFEITVRNSVGQKRIYNIYDCVATELLFDLMSNETKKGDSPELYLAKIQQIGFIKQKLRARNFAWLNSFTEKDWSKITFGELANILRNTLNEEYKAIQNGHRILTAEDERFKNLAQDFSDEDLSTVKHVKSIDQEMILQHPQGHKFGVNSMKHIADITYESIKKELNTQVYEVNNLELFISKDVKYKIPSFFMQDGGNIYLVENSANSNLQVSGLYPITDYVVEEEGKQYIKINNKTLLEVTDNLRDRLRIQKTSNNEPRLVILYNTEESKDKNTDAFWYNVQENINVTNGKESEFIITDIKKRNTITNQLDATEINVFTDGNKLKHLAKSKYAQFQLVLRFASTRIPGQSYQSFASTRVTNFLHGEGNAMFVNDYTIWLTGGDYDIDKLFSNGFGLTRNGKFIGWNPFFSENSYEHLIQSLALPGQDNKIQLYKQGESENAIDLTLPVPGLFRKADVEGGEQIPVTNFELLESIIHINTNGKTKIHTQIDLNKFQAFVALYNNLIKNGQLELSDEKANKKLIAMLDTTNATDFKAIDEGQALQNRITLSCRNNFSDIRNVVASYSPMSMSNAKDLKEASPKYQASSLVHPEMPIKQVDDISNQSAGKSVVGIEAAGLKLYATISYVVEATLHENKSPEEMKKMLFSQNIQTSVDADGNPVMKISNGFAGIEYRMNPELYRQQLNSYRQESKVQAQELLEADISRQLQAAYKEDSVQLQISQLLAQATDNGKEMILGIINSGKETQGVYLYALMIGYSLPQIGSIMTSKPIDFILRNINRSILLNEPYRNKLDVANYFLEGVPLKDFIPSGGMSNLKIALALGNDDKGNPWEIQDYNEDKLRILMIEKRELLSKLVINDRSEDDYEREYDDEFGGDFETETPTFNGYTKLKDWLDKRAEVNALIKEDKATVTNVKLFMSFVENGGLFASTTQVLSANQAVKSTDRDLINFYINFEDSIRNYLSNSIEKSEVKGEPDVQTAYSFSNNSFAIRGLVNPSDAKILKEFNMYQFFTDPRYARELIEIFDKYKSDLNPLAILYGAEHFREMIKTSLITDKIFKRNSLVYRTVQDFQENQLIGVMKENRTKTNLVYEEDLEVFKKDPLVKLANKKIVVERNLNDVAFGVLRNIADDVFVAETLKILQSDLNASQRIIQIKVGDEIKNVNLGELTSTTENQYQLGRKEFITFMEMELIPQLALGTIGITTTENPALYNNKFVKALVLKDFNIRNKPGNYFTAYGVQNFKSSDSSQVKQNQNQLMISLYDLNGFNYKASEKSNSVSIIDLLFLYNTILHRCKDGEFTLSSFFDPNKIPGSIVDKFYKQENKVNNNTKFLKISKEDLLHNGFDNSLNYKINIEQVKKLSTDYRYINVNNTSEVQTAELTLAEQLNNIFKVGFGNSEIKFTCE